MRSAPEERDAFVRAHEKEIRKVTAEKDDLTVQLEAVRKTLAKTQEQLERAEFAATSNTQASKTRPNPDLGEILELVKGSDATTENLSKASLEHGDIRTDIVLQLSQHTMPVSLEVITSNLKLNPTLAKGALRQLTSMNLVSKDSSGYWQLTALGEGIAVKLLAESKN
jgi:hypothetical protein